MAIDLNFNSLETAFLCLDHPIVINTIAIMFINGCSNEVNRKEASFICPKDANPNCDTKYKIRPTNNCVCVPINPNNAIFLSFGVNSFLEFFPINELTTAITNNKRAKYAQPE